jgi:hypothetical protein
MKIEGEKIKVKILTFFPDFSDFLEVIPNPG